MWRWLTTRCQHFTTVASAPSAPLRNQSLGLALELLPAWREPAGRVQDWFGRCGWQAFLDALFLWFWFHLYFI